MSCKSSRTPGIGYWVAILSLGLAGCPAGNDDTQVAAGPTRPDLVSETTQALQSAFPSGRTGIVGHGVSRLYGASLSTGATPAASADAFQRAYATARGIASSDLVPLDLKQGQAVASSAPEGIGLMYDQTTGQPKFWLYRSAQTRSGFNVYRSRLLTLVRNGADYPVVWSSSSLRDLSSFVAPVGLQARVPDRDKSLASILGTTNFTGRSLPRPQSIASLSPPELVVFAGTEDREVAPRMAIEYTATTAPEGKWHFVADASTGEVLSVESLVMYATITGKVTGNVTQGDVAMECAPEVQTAFPYAEVTGPQPAITFAGADGAYTLSGGFSGTVNVASPMLGSYFYVTNMAGPLEVLTDTVVPPATTANFLHDAADTDATVIAQANGYVQANQIRDFLLKYLPSYPTISTQMGFGVRVNISSTDSPSCPGGAWYDGDSVNFCLGGSTTTNMAFASVLHHEYGHHIVAMGTRMLAGGQDQYGEGMGDTVAVLYSGQSGVGIGVVLGPNQCTSAYREANNTCQYDPTYCSSCGSDTHGCGMLLSGTIWDIRKNLAATNPTTYVDFINSLTLSSIPLHIGTKINSEIAIDFLTLDDDDGNIDNGTPHRTEICSAFTAHGMTCPPILSGLDVNPKGALSFEGPVGGPFAPATVIYTVANLGPTSSIQYQVSAQPAANWLSISNGSGQLSIGQTAQVTVAINQAVANTLATGTFDTVVQFANLTNGVGTTTRVARLYVGLVPIFSETFEDGLPGGFTLGSEPTNLWHVSSGCASSQPGHSLPNSLYFGIDSSCNYDNGQTVMGTVTSVPVTITNHADTSVVKLRFNYFLSAEYDVNYDRASARVSINNGPFTVVASNNEGGVTLPGDGATWLPVDVDLTPMLVGIQTATLQVRFAFDSIDSAYNTTAGFLVDDVQILAQNLAPVVNAGPDVTVTLPAAATLVGTATDDGLPNPPAAVSIVWAKVSGPGSVTFSNATNTTTTAMFSQAGSYVLRLTGNDGALWTSDDVAVTVNPGNKAPVVNAGPDLTVLLTPAATLAGTVTDDGLPNPPGKVTASWSKYSGPGTVTFANAKLAATTATFSKTGTYVLRLTGNDSVLSTSDDCTVTVTTNKAPVMNAGPDHTITLPATASLVGTATDDGLPNPPAKVTPTWSKFSGSGTVTFANKNALSTTATFSAAGNYVLRLTGNDGALSGTDDIAITVNPAGTTPCTGLCTNPTNFTINGSYQSGNLGTGAVCFQTMSTLMGGNCGNFVSPRVLKVNGTTEPCTGANWASVPAKRNGGYCIQTTSGNQSFAYFTAF